MNLSAAGKPPATGHLIFGVGPPVGRIPRCRPGRALCHHRGWLPRGRTPGCHDGAARPRGRLELHCCERCVADGQEQTPARRAGATPVEGGRHPRPTAKLVKSSRRQVIHRGSFSVILMGVGERMTDRGSSRAVKAALGQTGEAVVPGRSQVGRGRACRSLSSAMFTVLVRFSGQLIMPCGLQRTA